MSYMNEKYTFCGIQWLGLLPSDLFKFNLHGKIVMNTSQKEQTKCKQMLVQYKTFFDTVKPSWGQELHILLESGIKAELQALTSESVTYFTDSYLPFKIENEMFL